MSLAPECLVIVEPEPQRGSWNMAVDEALLEAAVHSQLCALRWYRWSEPTLSLGYFQRSDEIAPELASLAAVRRLTGGGAIVHHHEVTYSCVIPGRHDLARDPVALYEAVHAGIIAVLERKGVPVRMRGEGRSGPGEPFLCFARGDARDIVLGGAKVVGSAQRRRRGAVMQHGSVVLRRSPYAADLPGLQDLVPEQTWDASIAGELAAEIAPLLGREVRRGALPKECRHLAEQLEAERYRGLDWNAPRAN